MSKNKHLLLYGILLIIIILVATWYNSLHNKNEGYQDQQSIDLDSTQIYVINLKKNEKRLRDFNDSYKKTDLQSHPIERIDAVYGIDIPYNDYIAENPEDKELTPGMVGCFLSHLKTYKQFINSGKQYAIIFEDDAKITNEEMYKTTISKLHEKIPNDWDIILLGYLNHDPKHKFEDRGDYYKFWNFWGTHSYIINRNSVQKLMSLMQPPFVNQIDSVMGSLARSDKLNIYGIKQVEVIQATPYSDVQKGIQVPF